MDYKLTKQEESVLRRDTWLWRRNTKKQMPPFGCLLYFLLKYPTFGGGKRKSGLIKYNHRMKSYVCLFAEMKGG